MTGAAETVLRVEQLSVRFGGVVALDRVDLEVDGGELVGLIGPNGAGKTTFVDAVTGFVAASGRVQFDGTDLTGRPSHLRARAGMARTWQSIELFEDLTVAENLMTGIDRRGLITSLLDLVAPGRRGGSPDVTDALDRFGLAPSADKLPNELSNGQRKLVGVARAFVARPKLLLLDEPAAGLDSDESTQLGTLLRSVVDGGVPVLLIDHDMDLMLSICDRLYVLEKGALLCHGTPAEIRCDPAVIAAYLGGAFSISAPEAGS